jgi:hypothetical protein
LTHYPNGDVYDGQMSSYQNNNDEFGVFFLNDGTKYEGYWLARKAHGKGIKTFPNGARYEGQFF